MVPLLGLGWIALVIGGVVAWRHGRRGVGVALTVCGALWGLLALGGFSYTYYRWPDYSHPQPTEFAPLAYQGPMGTLMLDWQGTASLRLTSGKDRKAYSLKTTNGRFRAPVGTFTLQTVSLVGQGDNGRTWTAKCFYPAATVAVAADTTVRLQFGPPLTARVKAGPTKNGKADFSFDCTDAAGHAYRLVAARKGAKPPGFEVVDDTGTVVWKGTFEYG